MQNKKITLILAGGGVKAVSYLGFIKVLEEKGLYENVDLIGSHSGGSLVGAAKLMGRDYDYIKGILKELSVWRMMDFSIFKQGTMMSNKKIDDYLDKIYGDTKFSDLTKQFVVYATNLTDKRLEAFSKGEIKKPIRASIALEPAISSEIINGKEYIDGGFATVFPTRHLQSIKKNNLVIGLIPKMNTQLFPKIFTDRTNYFSFFVEHARKLMVEKEPPDLYFETILTDKSHAFDFSNADYFYEQGYESGKQSILKIEELLEK
jgi:NTE family protein